MKNYFLALKLLIVALCFSSCKIFHPYNADIPLLEKKGDLHLDAGVSVTPFFDGYGLSGTASYAVSNWLGCQAAGSYSERRGSHIQAALGTFKTFGYGVAECYIGYAMGNVFHGHPYFTLKDIQLVFCQINYGFNHLLNDKIEVGFGMRGGLLYPDCQRLESYPELNPDLIEYYVNFNDRPFTKPHLHLNPQLVFRVGGEHLKFSVNVAYVYNFEWSNAPGKYKDHVSFNIGFGMHYKF